MGHVKVGVKKVIPHVPFGTVDQGNDKAVVKSGVKMRPICVYERLL